MDKRQYLQKILGSEHFSPKIERAQAFAPSNIALCKYWGKRCDKLNLPVTSSLSISLTDVGTTTTLSIIDADKDKIYLNDELVSADTPLAIRVIEFLNLFRGEQSWRCQVDTTSDIPIAAGLASSASGFAALTLSLNNLLQWQCDLMTLSRIARLGSGSAARSLWDGFVMMHAEDQDCYAEPIDQHWPEIRIGLLISDAQPKRISSREAMAQTVNTSPFYQLWPQIVKDDLQTMQGAIDDKDFVLLGDTAEKNALAMHATMLTAQPAICYWQASTLTNMQKVWSLREQGTNVYFTEDAGPNLKLIFLAQDQDKILSHWPECKIIQPFKG